MRGHTRSALTVFFSFLGGQRYPWHNVTSSVFWCGELPSPGDPGNLRSAYDPAWLQHYQSEAAFFAAVPYCDVGNGHTKESAKHIPWYQRTFIRDGQSIMKDRWIAVRHENKVCYCQIKDVGPHFTDDF